MRFFLKWSCFAFWNDLDDTKIGNYTIKSKIVDNKCTYSKRTLTITNPVIFYITGITLVISQNFH
jgi:hypothetical protein